MNKQMNNSIYKSILLILVLGISTSSCTDLTQVNPNFETEESFWETKEDFYQGLIGAYDLLQTGDMYAGQIQHTLNLLSDEGFTGQLGDPYNLATFSSDLNNEFHVTLWYSFYTLIARSYQIIERGENGDVSGIEGIIGEAKFLVALSYYNLISAYGDGIAFVNGIQSASDRPRKAEPGEMWGFTETLLTEAIKVLPVAYSSTEFGRITKGAAQALLAKIHMQQNDYSAAEQILSELIGSDQYKLNVNYESNFTEELTTGNKEVIFQINFLHNGPQQETDNNWFFRINSPGESSFGIWSDQVATNFALESYLVETDKDGNIDPRLNMSLFSNYSDKTLYGQTWEWWESNANIVSEASFYKFNENVAVLNELNNGSGSVQWKNGGKDMIVIRYADILLLYAEALNENGKTPEAHNYVNIVRARANMNNLEVTAGDILSQAEFREQIKHERLVELCGEFIRWFDLKRWGEYGPQIANDFTVPATGNIIARDQSFSNFRNGQDELFPIPLDELDLNPNLLPQNPGW
tara:strand:+ start:12978 stop:14546 length:1569 start_codon:yes stop_codon:yes gene_type:complete